MVLNVNDLNVEHSTTGPTQKHCGAPYRGQARGRKGDAAPQNGILNSDVSPKLTHACEVHNGKILAVYIDSTEMRVGFGFGKTKDQAQQFDGEVIDSRGTGPPSTNVNNGRSAK